MCPGYEICKIWKPSPFQNDPTMTATQFSPVTNDVPTGPLPGLSSDQIAETWWDPFLSRRNLGTFHWRDGALFDSLESLPATGRVVVTGPNDVFVRRYLVARVRRQGQGMVLSLERGEHASHVPPLWPGQTASCSWFHAGQWYGAQGHVDSAGRTSGVLDLPCTGWTFPLDEGLYGEVMSIGRLFAGFDPTLSDTSDVQALNHPLRLQEVLNGAQEMSRPALIFLHAVGIFVSGRFRAAGQGRRSDERAGGFSGGSVGRQPGGFSGGSGGQQPGGGFSGGSGGRGAVGRPPGGFSGESVGRHPGGGPLEVSLLSTDINGLSWRVGQALTVSTLVNGQTVAFRSRVVGGHDNTLLMERPEMFYRWERRKQPRYPVGNRPDVGLLVPVRGPGNAPVGQVRALGVLDVSQGGLSFVVDPVTADRLCLDTHSAILETGLRQKVDLNLQVVDRRVVDARRVTISATLAQSGLLADRTLCRLCQYLGAPAR